MVLKVCDVQCCPFASQDWMDNIPLYAVEAYFNSAGLGTGE